MTRISMIDVMERALIGRALREKDFDSMLFRRANELAREYGISYDPENPVPDDPGLADAVFRAGLRLFYELGAYCTNTNRVIGFDESEVKEALKHAPSEVWFGEGIDRRALRPRKPEDKRPPWCFLGRLEPRYHQREYSQVW